MPGLFGDLPPPSSTESKLKILESDEEDVEGQMTKRRRTEDFSAAEHKSPASDGALVDNEVNEAGEPEEQAPESTADADAAAATSVPVLAGDQVAAALAKIGSHIGQAKKFLKAAELLRELLSQGVVLERHAGFLFDALSASMVDPRRACDPGVSRGYFKLFSAASKHSQLFTPEQRIQLDGYGLWAVVQHQMATDDSFAFSKVVGNIKTLITELPDVESGAGASIDQEEQALVRLLPQSGAPSPAPSSPSGGAWSEVEALAMRRAALLDCVCAGRGCYAHAWARTSVDLLVDHAVAHAKRFLPSQRDALQAMATFVREQRAARKLGPSAKESARDTTAFERARQEWGRADVSVRGKVGAGGDHKSETWLG